MISGIPGATLGTSFLFVATRTLSLFLSYFVVILILESPAKSVGILGDRMSGKFCHLTGKSLSGILQTSFFLLCTLKYTSSIHPLWFPTVQYTVYVLVHSYIVLRKIRSFTYRRLYFFCCFVTHFCCFTQITPKKHLKKQSPIPEKG